MDWQALHDGIKAFVAAASGIEEHNVAWDGEPETMRSYPMAMLELVALNRDAAASDETRYEPNDDGQLVPVVVGQRVATLQVTIKSRNQRAPHKAYVIADRMRSRIELPAAQRALDELGVVVRDSAAIRDLSAVSQQREESVAQLSMTLSFVVVERDDDAEHLESTIERVIVSGEVAEAAQGDVIEIPEQTMP